MRAQYDLPCLELRHRAAFLSIYPWSHPCPEGTKPCRPARAPLSTRNDPGEYHRNVPPDAMSLRGCLGGHVHKIAQLNFPHACTIDAEFQTEKTSQDVVVKP